MLRDWDAAPTLYPFSVEFTSQLRQLVSCHLWSVNHPSFPDVRYNQKGLAFKSSVYFGISSMSKLVSVYRSWYLKRIEGEMSCPSLGLLDHSIVNGKHVSVVFHQQNPLSKLHCRFNGRCMYDSQDSCQSVSDDGPRPVAQAAHTQSTRAGLISKSLISAIAGSRTGGSM